MVGPSSVTATEGEEVTFTCQVTSTPEPVVTWMFNGTNVNISSDNYTITQTTDGDYSLTIRSVTTSNTGTYTCQVNNTAIPKVVMEDIDLSVNCEYYHGYCASTKPQWFLTVTESRVRVSFMCTHKAMVIFPIKTNHSPPPMHSS